MKTNKRILSLGFLLVLFTFVACSFTTANISSLKTSKDKGGNEQTSSFGVDDTVYGIAEVSNNPGKVKVKGRLAVDSVEGQQSGPIPGLETTVELPSSGTATFTFSPPNAGWPKGKYKLEVQMFDESGAQKDQKSADFSVM